MSPKPVPVLSTVSPPGLALFPGYTANSQQCFGLTSKKKSWGRDPRSVWFRDPATGKQGAELLDLEYQCGKLYVRDAKSRLVFVMHKKQRGLGPYMYSGYDAAGKEIFQIQVKEPMWKKAQYKIMLYPNTLQSQELILEAKVQGHERGLIWNGQLVATLDRPTMWKNFDYHLHVAQGMDIAFAVACAYCHLDRQVEGMEVGVAAAAAS